MHFFFVLNWFQLDIKQLLISLAVSLLSKSSRSQIDLNERESVFQSTNTERASSGYSFARIKTGFRDEKSALNSFGIRRRRERSKEIGGKEFGILRAGLYPFKRVSHTKWAPKTKKKYPLASRFAKMRRRFVQLRKSFPILCDTFHPYAKKRRGLVSAEFNLRKPRGSFSPKH